VALLPTAVAADLIGRLTDNDSLMDMRRQLMPVATASVAATGSAGFAAQEAVSTSDTSHDILVTHRLGRDRAMLGCRSDLSFAVLLR